MSAEEALLRGLLPSFFWLRDDEQGKALAALVSALAEQHGALRADVERLYDDLFVETCSAEVVPLIAGNVGVSGAGSDDRVWVGQIVGLRRGKGTLAALARGVAAATGWGVSVQDAIASLGRTHSLLEPDSRRGSLLDLADTSAVEELEEPWSRTPRRAAVSGRPLSPGLDARPAASTPTAAPAPASATVGIWRLASFAVTGRTPRRARDAPPALSGRAFRIDPLGRDVPLFTQPASGVEDGTAAGLARPLGIAELKRLLRHAGPEEGPAPLRIAIAGEDEPMRPVASSRVGVADLSDWRVPSSSEGESRALVDPLRGRLVVLGGRPARIEVDSAYGFAGELGGGPYGSPAGPARQRTTIIRVARSGRGTHRSLAAALAAWRSAGPTSALISIEDSATDTSEAEGWLLELDTGMRLELASTAEAAPVLDGEIRAHVPAGAELRLRGLTLAGALDVHGEGALSLEHTTVAPASVSARIALRGGLTASAARCVLGAVQASGPVQLALRACIVDGAIGDARRPLETLDAAQATVLGAVAARVLLAEDCIFLAPVTSADPARGVVRTSYLPARSTPPRLVSCLDEADGRPRFTSTRWGAPGYGQLAAAGPHAIAVGASGGGELGAFNWLGQPARFERLSAVLRELLPAGIGATVELHT